MVECRLGSFGMCISSLNCRLEDHLEWTGPQTLRQFDKRMASATDGLKEGLEWGDIINAGGSPAPLLGLHTSHPTEQVCLKTVTFPPPEHQSRFKAIVTFMLMSSHEACGV